MTASEQTYFELNYTFYLNLIAFALSGFLLYVYRRGLGSTRSVPILSVECEPARMVQPSSTMVIPTISVRRRVDEPSRRHPRSSL